LRRAAQVEQAVAELLIQGTVRAVAVAVAVDKKLRAARVVALVAAAVVLPGYPLLLDLGLMAAQARLEH
jgi:hypothetical protein